MTMDQDNIALTGGGGSRHAEVDVDEMEEGEFVNDIHHNDLATPQTHNPRHHRRRTLNRSLTAEEFSTIDLESGKRMTPRQFHAEKRRKYGRTNSVGGGEMRRQSKRMSELMQAKTEIYSLNQAEPDTLSDEERSLLHKEKSQRPKSGLAFWTTELEKASEHGGDYTKRFDAAMRASLGSFLVFSLLVLTQQHYLGAVWIGNIFMHSSLKDSFGASLISFQGFATSIILTTAAAFPAGYLLKHIGETEGEIALPFIIFVYSFGIMTCPQLTSRNLMVLVAYIVIATEVREDIEIWEPFGWVATYIIGLAVALLMNVIPRPNFALNTTSVQLKRLEKDLIMLLYQCAAYADHTALEPGVARAAVATIEMLYKRINTSVKTLKAKLPAAKVELFWKCNRKAGEDLDEWISGAEQLLKPLKSLRTALVQRVLGEEYAMSSESLKQAKEMIMEEVGPSRDRLLDAMLASVAVCDAWADPQSHRTVLPDVQDELDEAIQECREAFHHAMTLASSMLQENHSENVQVAIFAHLTRRMSAFNALFELGDAFLMYLKKHSWEQEDVEMAKRQTTSPCEFILGFFMGGVAWLETKWLYHTQDGRRLALKTAIGMAIASLWVSVPFFWEIAQPFGVWPGLTIASVNLGSTGSSFHKAADRLFGTLLAAAYALLIADLFPANVDFVKIPAIAVFTFIIIYLKDSEHAYKYTYAATSIGSMLYGSVKNDFNIAGYIPKRIELIFVGVLIFGFIELMLFPRSSRKMVERESLEYFVSVRDFFRQALVCTTRMEDYVRRTPGNTNWLNKLVDEDDDDIFQIAKLTECHKTLKAQSSKIKKELNSALDEPQLGLSLPLNPESFRGLSSEQCDVEMQAFLLLKAVKTLAKYCQDKNHPIRELDWPHIHTQFLRHALDTADFSVDWLEAAFPDGKLRAQNGNALKAVTAAAAFRGFEDVRLRTISEWSQNYSDFIRKRGFDGSDPISILTLGITTSFILELCRHLQKAGKHVEKIAHNFPATGEKKKRM